MSDNIETTEDKPLSTFATKAGVVAEGGGLIGKEFFMINNELTYERIISLDNLLAAWQEFLPGKRGKPDVQEFGFRLMDNLLDLHQELKERGYRHGDYEHFKINDPKPRDIHKASVCDRLIHHAIYRVLYPYFDRRFVADSFSCRLRKGTHKALDRFQYVGNQVSNNDTRQCWVLKCDVRKFFASIDHAVLKEILAKYISDLEILRLLINVIDSFQSTREGIGLPLGNLTSQLLTNIYMNEFDQYVKHQLKAKYYIRYADDFVFVSEDRKYLEQLISKVQSFLGDRLKLELHPGKVFIKTLSSGIDFLGWVHFADHRVLRTSTKRRMLHHLAVKPPSGERVQSYLGILQHGNAQKILNRMSF
ncbi:MAG TPA: reverse transcriptase/maturase family protein [Candidatus Paceibacterota bacterium]